MGINFDLFDAETLRRFRSKFEPADMDACWEWKASKTTSGYGQFMIRPRLIQRAHRISWALANHTDPGENVVRHKCDNPSCVNPAHLEIGSQLDNIADMHSRGRASGGSVSRAGESHPLHKLTEADVAEIRNLRASGESGRSVAKRFGISPAQVSRIHTGKRWANLEAVRDLIALLGGETP